MRARDLVRSAPKGGTVETTRVQGHRGLPPAETGPAGYTGATPTPKMVLVVGEDPAAQGSLAELLVRAGYGLMQTTNGSDVLRIVLHYRPDVILLHLTPGGTWILDVLHALQTDAQAHHIPIVVLSASAWPLLTPEATGTCVISHQPLKPRRLLAQLAKLVGQAPAPGETRQEPGPAQENVSLPVTEAAWLSMRSIACWQSAFDASICLVARASQLLADSIRKRDLPWRFCSILQRLTTHFLIKRRQALLSTSPTSGCDVFCRPSSET